LVQQFKGMGDVLSYDTSRNSQVPENDLATAQITLVVGGANPIGLNDEGGVSGFARKSLNWSFTIFAYCILAIIAGLSALVPVGAVVWITFKAVRWFWPGESASVATTTKPAASSDKPAGGEKPAS